ncbi:DNA-binding domain-containing protein [uncultured Hoeflea sp.]|uniref:DNA-binding domain-containing protein n=1 Tax=uncultured Hoeflea sp. TaxID=538666 RepID=UPI0030ED5E85|tara:strand:+ start:5728 stop:6531 length:804 start_codon:yes stop_codon:yes gene_type:complete
MPRSDAVTAGEQHDFGAALLDSDLPLPEGIVGPHGKKAEKRFAVYRNNVTVSLINALADIFPAVQRLVGEDFFRDMARLYIAKEPPGSAVIFEYGGGFAAFLENFEPLSRYPYLADVARLEKAWLAAFHAADAAPLQPETLAAIPPVGLAELRFTAHPAARIIQSPFAAISIFTASREQRPLDDIKSATPEDGLITRPSDAVEVRQLPPGAAKFLGALIAGNTLGEAAGQTMADHPGFDLPAAISAMLEAGVFSACSASQPNPEHTP